MDQEDALRLCTSMNLMLKDLYRPEAFRRSDLESFLLDDDVSPVDKAAAIRGLDSSRLADLFLSHRHQHSEVDERDRALVDADLQRILTEFDAWNRPKATSQPPTANTSEEEPPSSLAEAVVDDLSDDDDDELTLPLRNYRAGHPELNDDEQRPLTKTSMNVDFYRGAIYHPSLRCSYIDDFHDVEKYRRCGSSAANTVSSLWFGNYERLESCHHYIQFLFPIQSGRGMCSEAQQLYKHEIVTMREDPTIQQRLVRSVETMLDFYGIEGMMLDSQAPTLTRHSAYESRFSNLNRFSHNFLRISRILMCLGDLGREALQEAIAEFFVSECFEYDVNHTSPSHCLLPAARHACETHWIQTIRNPVVRKELRRRVAAAKRRQAKQGNTNQEQEEHSFSSSV